MLLLSNNISRAQVLDGIYAKEHVPSRKPIPYKFLREADVMWAQRVWRVIDLREKINHPLYFPTTKIGDRMSLIDLLLWGINTEGLTAYNTDDDRFTQPMSMSQIDQNFGAVEKNITFTDENGETQTKAIKGEVTSSEVKQYWLKEDWFFDRQHSTMDVRIIGLSPVRFYTKMIRVGWKQKSAECGYFGSIFLKQEEFWLTMKYLINLMMLSVEHLMIYSLKENLELYN
jgi:gliding motility associated protien GldN